MRGVRAVLHLGWVGLLGLAGCTTAQDIRKPPKLPEELTVAPVDEPRFSQPVKLPKPDEDAFNHPTPTNLGGMGAGGLRGPGNMGGSAMGGPGNRTGYGY